VISGNTIFEVGTNAVLILSGNALQEVMIIGNSMSNIELEAIQINVPTNANLLIDNNDFTDFSTTGYVNCINGNGIGGVNILQITYNSENESNSYEPSHFAVISGSNNFVLNNTSTPPLVTNAPPNNDTNQLPIPTPCDIYSVILVNGTIATPVTIPTSAILGFASDPENSPLTVVSACKATNGAVGLDPSAQNVLFAFLNIPSIGGLNVTGTFLYTVFDGTNINSSICTVTAEVLTYEALTTGTTGLSSSSTTVSTTGGNSTACLATCGPHSHCSFGSCVCDSGYDVQDSSCVLLQASVSSLLTYSIGAIGSVLVLVFL